MTNEEQAKRISSDLAPSDGWWKRGTGETIESCATSMLESGLSEVSVALLIDRLISAAHGEYGE